MKILQHTGLEDRYGLVDIRDPEDTDSLIFVFFTESVYVFYVEVIGF